MLILPSLNYLRVLPDAARVVLRSRDDRVSFVVKGAREDFVFMAVEHLQFAPSVRRPDPAALVAACRDNLVSLRIELYFTDFIFMALQQSNASTCEDIINPCKPVRACRC